MKKLVLKSKGVLSLVNTVSPVPNSKEEVITVEVAGLGGSEYLGLANPGIRNLPNAMAHGVVGSTERGVKVAVYPIEGCGCCKYCHAATPQLCDAWKMIGVHSDGGFSQELAVSKSSLVEIPDTLSWEQAAFIEPFANSVNAVELAGITSDSNIAVIGAGGLGLGVVAQCMHKGYTKIATIDPSEARCKAAQELGSATVATLEADYYDVVFDTVGTVNTRDSAVVATSKTGVCVLLGFGEARIDLDGGSFIRGQKRIVGSFAYSIEQFRKAIPLAEMTNPKWVRNLSFDEVQLQLQAFLSGNFETVKAVLRPKL